MFLKLHFLLPTNCTDYITITISNFIHKTKSSRDSVIHIAIGNEFCGPDFETRCGRDILYLSRPVPKSYSTSCKMVPGVLRRGKCGWVVVLAIHSF